MLVQLEIFVAHSLKGREALCCDLFLLLSQGVVYQMLEAVTLDLFQSELTTRATP